jgi:hypothetical protein
MTPEPISMAYFINSSHQSLCLLTHAVARQQLGKNVTPANNTLINIRIVERVVFYDVRVV